MGNSVLDKPAAAEPHPLDGGFKRIPEVARFLGVSRSKVYKLMDSGQIASVRFGKSRRIPQRALYAFAEAALAGATR